MSRLGPLKMNRFIKKGDKEMFFFQEARGLEGIWIGNGRKEAH